jgi:hypothetical protein
MVGSKESRTIKYLLSKNYVFPFFAFAVPLLLRAIPEVLMGSYLVGFDTMGHYVPNTLLWLRGDIPFSVFVGTAPLFYSLIVSLVSLGGSLVMVLKVVSVVLEGFLGLSIYWYAQKGLGWSPKKSIAPALLGTLYFVALRVSMDSLRNMLGLVFFFVLLTLFSFTERKGCSWKHYALISLSMVAVVLSHQLVSVIMLGVFAFTIGYKFLRNEHKKATRLALAYLPSALLFLAVLLFFSSVSEFRLIFGFSNANDGWLSLFGFTSYHAMLLSEAGFIFYCFLPLLPFLLWGIWHLKNLQVRSWIGLSLILLFVPLVSPSNLRWVLMLTYPLAFCAIEALIRLKYIPWKHFSFTLYRIGLIYLVMIVSVLSLGFMSMQSEHPFPYFATPENGYIYQIPTSMLQNTVSKIDCPDTVSTLQWFKNNVDSSAVLLTHRAFYGWAMLTLNANQIVLYEYDNPANTAKPLAQQEHNKIFLIWWVNGQGWYGQPTVSSSFEEIYHSGKIALYSYRDSS